MSVTNFFTTIVAALIECLIVIYYSNSVMNYRHSRFKSNLYIVIGYSVYAGICLFGKPVLNVFSGIGIMFTVLYLGFSDNIGYIALKVIIIMLLSMFGEWVVSLFFKINIDNSFNQNISDLDDIIFTLTAKLILYISVLILRRFSVKRDKIYKMQDILLFLVLPVSTVFLLSSLEKICLEISMNHTIRILLAALFIVISNFIVYIVYDKMLDKTEKINQLQEIAYKENIDYRSYELIKEKYEDLKIMVHNFEKYCNNIEGMIGIQSNEAASFINVLKDKNKEFLLVEYTNNKALNILLSQKQRQCSKEKIDFQLYIQDIDLSFIKEIDIVSIFSNLLDNSIESSRNSENKKIFLSVQMMNNSFVVVRIDNSCDSEPIVYDGIMHTQKRNKEQHGLGIISVKKSLAKYNGNMDWDYDKDNRLFSVILLINCFKQNSDI